MLRRLGVETTYYDPLIGGGIREHMRPETKVVWVESPGSWTFEVQDIPAIAEVAHAGGATVIMDNTWASPLYFKPFEHGVDVSVQAVTKYISGHSDLVMGSVSCTEEAYPAFQKAQEQTGVCPSPDDVYLAMRGIRTIHARLPRHWESGLRVAEWLMGRDEVAQVMHPAMEHDRGHALWKRDFLGASSLFGFTLAEQYSNEAALAAMMDSMRLHGMGYSWGGFESLLIPTEPQGIRSATRWPREDVAGGQAMRIHVGLEAVEDIIDDLSDGFDRLRKAS
jgi:cystathionine beta-lyase